MARKRELTDTGTDKRYVRRNERGTSFVESDDVGHSLAVDRRRRAKTKAKSGQGDKGDRQSARRQTKQLAGKAPLGSLPDNDQPVSQKGSPSKFPG